MDITLNVLLNKTLIVPYEDEVVERLGEICNEYVTDDDFNDDDVAELAVMVLTHKSDPAFKEKLEESYEAKYSESFTIPKSVCEMMAAYCLMLAIEQEKLTFYLALLNTMIIQSGQLEHLPYASFFAEAMEKALQTVDAECKMEEADEKTFVSFGVSLGLAGAMMAAEVYNGYQFNKYYANEKFIRVLDDGVYPETRWVETSNYVDIGFKIDDRTGRIIMMGALDNLVKGAAGQAVQNMNILFGLDESMGLDLVPCFP